jgi:hypothetical protein
MLCQETKERERILALGLGFDEDAPYAYDLDQKLSLEMWGHLWHLSMMLAMIL